MNNLLSEHTRLLPNIDLHEVDKDHFTWRDYPKHALRVTWLTLASNPVNLLLVFVPVGIIAGAIGWSPTAVFVLNFFAIIPLASLLSFATEELSAKLGQTLGGLLNATFGNAVELIVSIVALRDNQVRIVQSSMLGSILSNTLLVLGCCFLAGGARNRPEQEFNTTAAQTMASLMAVASVCLIIPATLYAVMDNGSASDKNILVLSHGTAIIMLILYVLYLVFQLKTHAKMFEGKDEGSDSSNNNTAESHANTQSTVENGSADGPTTSSENRPSSSEPRGEEEEEHILTPVAAGVALVLITILVAICAEYLVDSIDSIVETSHISKTFIGMILIPIVGNAAEHVTAVVVSWKNKMDLAIGVAVGSSLQIALGVTPALVILGWIMGVDMTLHFQTFETVVFFLSVLVVNYLIQDGKSNYLEGAMLIGVYIVVALAFWVYPDNTG